MIILIIYETKTDFYVQTKTYTNQNFTNVSFLKEKYFRTFRKFERQAKTCPIPKLYIKTISSGNTLIIMKLRPISYKQKHVLIKKFTNDSFLKEKCFRTFR